MQRTILTKHRVYELAPDARGVPVENDVSGQALELLHKCPLAGAAFAAVLAIRTLSVRPPAADQIWER
jgi:hypothetical protein